MTIDSPTITFACDGCGRSFTVPAAFAGRKAACKTCGNKVAVPGVQRPAEPPATVSANDGQPASPALANALSPGITPAPAGNLDDDGVPTSDPARPATRPQVVPIVSEAQAPPTAAMVALAADAVADLPEPSPEVAARFATLVQPEGPAGGAPRALGAAPAPKVPVRTRRLIVDAEQMAAAFSDGGGPIRIKAAVGDPPENYRIEYHVNSLQRGWFGKPKKRDVHSVEIQLTSEYPHVSPLCRMLTPIFHPNIDESTICVGDHWTAGERLVDLVVRIGEMLAYQAYNIKSPLDGEAAMWADLHGDQLPTDARNLHPE